jgi:TniQ
MPALGRDTGLSGKVWPAHVKPRRDELLSSWLVRLAASHGQKLHTFCALVWSRGKPIWNRDIDKCADASILDVLAEKTATPPERAARTTLAAYEGHLYERHNPHGNTLWIMPVGVYHRTRRLHGLQFCPRCLAEDSDPYYRRAWRLAFVTFCERHRCPVFDRCPRCSAPVNFHRVELGDRRKWVAESVTLCHSCRFDLRESPAAAVERPADLRVLEFQKSLTVAMRRGWIEMSGHGPVYSHLYFAVLHQLMKVCATGKRAADLREAVSRELKIEEPPGLMKSCRDIERLDVGGRRELLDMARHLLDEWPARFVRLCETYNVWSAALLRELEPAPFWYWRVVHDRLYRVSYTPSDEEVRSAIAHLSRRGITPCKRSISRCLGTNDVFRKRKTGATLMKSMSMSAAAR